MDNTYNGFSGKGTKESAWATWNLCLWVDNDYEVYKAKMRFIQGCIDVEDVNAKSCEEFCKDFYGTLGTDDMNGDEYDDVCWDEVADNWHEEFYENEHSNRSDEENELRKNLGLERTDELEDERLVELAKDYISDLSRDEQIDFIMERMNDS